MTAESIKFKDFMDQWDRGEELRSILEKLPARAILRSGQSARLKKILDRWDNIESPGLDGSVPELEYEKVSKWIRDAEIMAAFIAKIIKDDSITPIHTKDETYIILNSISEANFICRDWQWPWDQIEKQKDDSKKWDKSRIIKFGIVAGIGVAAILTYLED